MNGPLALLFPAATSLDVHEIAVASLEAFLQRHAPSLPVMRLAVPTALPHPIELALYRAHPTLIVLWCPPEGIWALEPLLTRLRPLLPTSSIVLAGPARSLAAPGDVVVCMGAGSISAWANALPQRLEGGAA